MTTLEKAQAGQRIRITQRHAPCNCGCGGTDPWHSKRVTRRIRDITVLDKIKTVKDAEGRPTNIIATGTYKHQSEPRACGLFAVIHPETKKIHQINWFAIVDETVGG